MFKKSIAILSVIIAQAIIMGHTLVPHQHAGDRAHEHALAHAEGADHHHHDDGDTEETDPLQLAFANFAHGVDVNHYLTNNEQHVVFTKHITKDFISDRLDNFYFRVPAPVLKQELPPGNLRLYQTDQLTYLSLRGPPFFIV